MREIAAYIASRRTVETPFDIIKYGLTEGKNLAQERAMVEEFAAAGVTWWIEEIYSGRGTLKKIEARLQAGPPR